MNRSCAIVALLCAWVLWREVDTTEKGRTVTFWTLEAAEETKRECLDSLKARLVRSFGEKGDPAGYITIGDTWALEKYESKTRRHTYWCLPAGTDPRPRS